MLSGLFHHGTMHKWHNTTKIQIFHYNLFWLLFYYSAAQNEIDFRFFRLHCIQTVFKLYSNCILFGIVEKFGFSQVLSKGARLVWCVFTMNTGNWMRMPHACLLCTVCVCYVNKPCCFLIGPKWHMERTSHCTVLPRSENMPQIKAKLVWDLSVIWKWNFFIYFNSRF